MIVKYLCTGHWLLLGEEESNPMIGAGLSTLLLVQTTTTTICSTPSELHQHSNPDPTSDLTYRPNTTHTHTPKKT
jgi:hypothetical protein